MLENSSNLARSTPDEPSGPLKTGILALLAAVKAGVATRAAPGKDQTLRDEVLAKLAQLTARERDVFDAVAAGESNKSAAQLLGISPRTVEIYRANVMEKMQARSLADLVRMSLIASD